MSLIIYLLILHKIQLEFLQEIIIIGFYFPILNCIKKILKIQIREVDEINLEKSKKNI